MNNQDFNKMANGHGGIRKGQGRKRKADEEKIRRLGEGAIVKIYGSIDKYYQHIAKKSKESFPHLKLLQEYVFGKPLERMVIEDDETEDIDLSELTDDELMVLTKLHARKRTNTEDTDN